MFKLNLIKSMKFWIKRRYYFCSKSLANLESKMNFQTKYDKKWPCEKSLIMNLPLNWFWFQLCFYNPQDLLKNYYIIDIHGHEPGLRPIVHTCNSKYYTCICSRPISKCIEGLKLIQNNFLVWIYFASFLSYKYYIKILLFSVWGRRTKSHL